MVEMIFMENVCFSGLAFLQCDWKMHLHMLQMHEFGMFLLAGIWDMIFWK